MNYSIFLQRTNYCIPHCPYLVLTEKNEPNSCFSFFLVNNPRYFGFFNSSANRGNLSRYLLGERRIFLPKMPTNMPQKRLNLGWGLFYQGQKKHQNYSEVIRCTSKKLLAEKPTSSENKKWSVKLGKSK